MKRRHFLGLGSALTATSLVPAPLLAMPAATADARAPKPLELLVLGGTRFIGLHMTSLALARGHRVTFFNRGRTQTDRFPEIPRLIGDRNGSLDALKGRRFDAVIDNSGYTPRQVRSTAEILKATTPHYLFVSSISVYAGMAQANDESSPVGRLADESIETVDGSSYGPLKALCERAAQTVYGEAGTTILRPGLIVGPDDNTDRFTYWPVRAARGGTLIAPGRPVDPIQLIDVRDLAAFSLRCLERRIMGVYNVVSEPGRFAMGDLIGASIDAAQRLVRPTPPPKAEWIDADFLATQDVTPWADMPVWVPSEGDSAGFAATKVTRALSAGLSIRPLTDTVEATLRWHLARANAATLPLKAGIAPAREAEVLKAWQASR